MTGGRRRPDLLHNVLHNVLQDDATRLQHVVQHETGSDLRRWRSLQELQDVAGEQPLTFLTCENVTSAGLCCTIGCVAAPTPPARHAVSRTECSWTRASRFSLSSAGPRTRSTAGATATTRTRTRPHSRQDCARSTSSRCAASISTTTPTTGRHIESVPGMRASTFVACGRMGGGQIPGSPCAAITMWLGANCFRSTLNAAVAAVPTRSSTWTTPMWVSDLSATAAGATTAISSSARTVRVPGLASGGSSGGACAG